MILVTFQSPELHLLSSPEEEISRQDNNTSTRSSNRQPFFPRHSFLTPLFQRSIFFSAFLGILASYRITVPPFIPLTFFRRSRKVLPRCDPDVSVTSAVNSFAVKRSHISHFPRPLIEDRCTSRGSALYSLDEGTVDHNDPPKVQWRTSSLQWDHCRPENHSAMTKSCVRAPANML